MTDPAFGPARDDEWQDLLHQLQDQPPVQPRPFFYNRVSARLATQAAARVRPLRLRMLRPAYAALLGVMVLVLSGDVRAVGPAAPTTATESGQPLSSPPQ